MMETKKVLTRENIPTEELTTVVEKLYKGIRLKYTEVYYLDFSVNEETENVDKNLKEKYYTKTQMERNMKALKNAYLVAKGAASPKEIIDFRLKYHISASTFSIILGFSKNTISNIENEGITSLSTGRLIKMCIENKKIIYDYVQLCDLIDNEKKQEISKRLMVENT
jgi:DNA-binding transcriptional regulator YiaG